MKPQGVIRRAVTKTSNINYASMSCSSGRGVNLDTGERGHAFVGGSGEKRTAVGQMGVDVMDLLASVLLQ